MLYIVFVNILLQIQKLYCYFQFLVKAYSLLFLTLGFMPVKILRIKRFYDCKSHNFQYQNMSCNNF